MESTPERKRKTLLESLQNPDPQFLQPIKRKPSGTFESLDLESAADSLNSFKIEETAVDEPFEFGTEDLKEEPSSDSDESDEDDDEPESKYKATIARLVGQITEYKLVLEQEKMELQRELDKETERNNIISSEMQEATNAFLDEISSYEKKLEQMERSKAEQNAETMGNLQLLMKELNIIEERNEQQAKTLELEKQNSDRLKVELESAKKTISDLRGKIIQLESGNDGNIMSVPDERWTMMERSRSEAETFKLKAVQSLVQQLNALLESNEISSEIPESSEDSLVKKSLSSTSIQHEIQHEIQHQVESLNDMRQKIDELMTMHRQTSQLFQLEREKSSLNLKQLQDELSTLKSPPMSRKSATAEISRKFPAVSSNVSRIGKSKSTIYATMSRSEVSKLTADTLLEDMPYLKDLETAGKLAAVKKVKETLRRHIGSRVRSPSRAQLPDIWSDPSSPQSPFQPTPFPASTSSPMPDPPSSPSSHPVPSSASSPPTLPTFSIGTARKSQSHDPSRDSINSSKRKSMRNRKPKKEKDRSQNPNSNSNSLPRDRKTSNADVALIKSTSRDRSNSSELKQHSSKTNVLVSWGMWIGLIGSGIFMGVMISQSNVLQNFVNSRF